MNEIYKATQNAYSHCADQNIAEVVTLIVQKNNAPQFFFAKLWQKNLMGNTAQLCPHQCRNLQGPKQACDKVNEFTNEA